jgi:hypothetical protein
MDVVTHGLWGALAFGRKGRGSFWLAFVIGLAPDLLSFGILYAAAMVGLAEKPDFSHGTPPESTIPLYVHHLYDVTHSLLVFVALFLLVWLVVKRPVWELLSWGLHILVDIPTHSLAFFPTPFLWPLSDWKFDGWQWMTPTILIPNFIALSLCYGWFLWDIYRPAARREAVRE